jgi:aromatic-L-amino-acid/L-tryptophan decarboxylase
MGRHSERYRKQDHAGVDTLVYYTYIEVENDAQAETGSRQSPNFMAFFPATTTYPSMLGELYSAAFSAPAFNWQCSPAVTELETIVLDWVARILHLPSCFLSEGEGGGVIQGSASEAVVTVMVAARERYLQQACVGLDGKEKEAKVNVIRGRLVALGSEESHSSVAKAALIAGVRYKSISTRFEDDLAMTGESLLATLEECKRCKLEPFFLSTTLGTTATCATDRFHEIADIMTLSPNIWIHVDAAYAGAVLLLEEYAHLTTNFASFDSFNMNMHKWLLTNFDASVLYVRKRRDLTSALSITPSYLRNSFSDSGLVTDYRDWQIPLGRRFRALKIWFVLRTYGVDALKEHVRKHIKMGDIFSNWIRDRPDLFTIITPPAYALTVFTLALPNYDITSNGRWQISNSEHTETKVNDGLADSDVLPTSASASALGRTNALAKDVYEKINAAGEIFLTSTIVKGIYAIRVVSANERADEEHLKKAFEILVREVGNTASAKRE